MSKSITGFPVSGSRVVTKPAGAVVEEMSFSRELDLQLYSGLAGVTVYIQDIGDNGEQLREIE